MILNKSTSNTRTSKATKVKKTKSSSTKSRAISWTCASATRRRWQSADASSWSSKALSLINWECWNWTDGVSCCYLDFSVTLRKTLTGFMKNICNSGALTQKLISGISDREVFPGLVRAVKAVCPWLIKAAITSDTVLNSHGLWIPNLGNKST